MLAPLISLAIAFLISVSAVSSQIESWDLKYCVPVQKIDFNPFREIVDGKDLAYLLLLRSYISTDQNEPGILKAYEFSPDGKLFVGKLSDNLTWSDGSKVSPREVAFGIAKALPFRAIGKRVEVVGTEGINNHGWQEKEYSGIEIVNENTFKLKFKSEIENLTGVIREALSTNSRHNRFWPIKLTPDTKNSPYVLLKFPQMSIGSETGLKVEHLKILLADSSKCQGSDFSIFPEVLGKHPESYLLHKSNNQSSIVVQPNSVRLKISERSALIKWIRSAFVNYPVESGIVSVESFFLMGESGFDPNSKWSTELDVKKLKARHYRIAFEIPIFKTVIERAAKRDGLNISFINLPTSDDAIDAQVLAAGMQQGRHLILQDILQWSHVGRFFQATPKTVGILKSIAKMSASTMPPDIKTLKEFERAALMEQSIAPVARKHPTAFSRPNLPICLNWTLKGELSFSAQNICRDMIK